MRVPTDIQRMVADGLSAVDAHPEHQYDWRRRRDMYQHMHDSYGERGREAHGWLAVLAAEHVLPLFTSTFPDDPLPRRLVETARQIMQKGIPLQSAALDALEDEGYLATGIDCMTWRPTIAYNAEYAGEAAYKVLMEARGVQDLLHATERLICGQEVQVFAMPANMSAEAITDREIAHLAAYSDTASAAAIAAACDKEQFRLNRHQLKVFWEWWGTTAMTEAWASIERTGQRRPG